MPTRAECEAQAAAAVQKWVEALGLHGEWHVIFVFGRPDTDGTLAAGDAACVSFDIVHRAARVCFSERLIPACYEHEAVHEVLHIFFRPIAGAIEQLTEPAKSLLEDALHSRIVRLSTVLSGTQPMHGNEIHDRPPWESEAPV